MEEEPSLLQDHTENQDDNSIENSGNEVQPLNLLDPAAPGFIVMNQSGQFITAAELGAAISQQMQMYTLENQLPVVLTNTKTQILDESTSVQAPSHSRKGDGVPPHKIAKRVSAVNSENSSDSDQTSDLENSIRSLLEKIQAGILQRLENFSKRIEDFSTRCQSLEETVQSISNQVRDNKSVCRVAVSSGKKRDFQPSSVIVGLQVASDKETCMAEEQQNINAININDAIASKKLADYNSEERYPNGSWLGNPNDPAKRVRCHISELDLMSLNQGCNTPEKLAVTLLDHLFDRETQAHSNISGNSKYNKKQLDPTKIFGIKCHLDYRFGIEDKDWHRIKQNLDSKCRTAFRRKQKGKALTVKAFSKNAANNQLISNEDSQEHIYPTETSQLGQEVLQNFSLSPSELGLHGAVPIALHTADGLFSLPIGQEGLAEGEIQVIHATPEQIAQFQQTHQIQIFTSPQVMKNVEDILEEDEQTEDNQPT